MWRRGNRALGGRGAVEHGALAARNDHKSDDRVEAVQEEIVRETVGWAGAGVSATGSATLRPSVHVRTRGSGRTRHAPVESEHGAER